MESHNSDHWVEPDKTNNSDPNLSELESSPIVVTTERCVKDLVEIFNKVMSSISDQEEFLNEQWKDQSMNNFEKQVIPEESFEELQNDESFYHSTPKSIPSKFMDNHHCLDNTEEHGCQTIQEEETSSDHSITDASVPCPKCDITGLEDSTETTNLISTGEGLHTTDAIAFGDGENGTSRAGDPCQPCADIVEINSVILENHSETSATKRNHTGDEREELTNNVELDENGTEEKIAQELNNAKESNVVYNVSETPRDDSFQIVNEPTPEVCIENEGSNVINEILNDGLGSNLVKTCIENEMDPTQILDDEMMPGSSVGNEEELNNDNSFNKLWTDIVTSDSDIYTNPDDATFNSGSRSGERRIDELDNNMLPQETELGDLNRLGERLEEDSKLVNVFDEIDSQDNCPINSNAGTMGDGVLSELKAAFRNDSAEEVHKVVENDNIDDKTSYQGPFPHQEYNVDNENIVKENEDQFELTNYDNTMGLQIDSSDEYFDDPIKNSDLDKSAEQMNNTERMKTKSEEESFLFLSRNPKSLPSMFDSEDPTNTLDPIRRCNVDHIIANDSLIISDHSSISDRSIEPGEKKDVIPCDMTEDVKKCYGDIDGEISKNDYKSREDGDDADHGDLEEENTSLSKITESKDLLFVDQNELDFHQLEHGSNLQKIFMDDDMEEFGKVMVSLSNSDLVESFGKDQSGHNKSCPDFEQIEGRDSDQYLSFAKLDESIIVLDLQQEMLEKDKDRYADPCDNLGQGMEAVQQNKETITGSNDDMIEMGNPQYDYAMILSKDPSFVNINNRSTSFNIIHANVANNSTCPSDTSVSSNPPSRSISGEIGYTSPNLASDHFNSENSPKIVDLCVDSVSPVRIDVYINDHHGDSFASSDNASDLPMGTADLSANDAIGCRKDISVSVCGTFLTDFENLSPYEMDKIHADCERKKDRSSELFDQRHSGLSGTAYGDDEIVLPTLSIIDDIDDPCRIRKISPLDHNPERCMKTDFPWKPEMTDFQIEPLGLHEFEDFEDHSLNEEMDNPETVNIENEAFTSPTRHRTSLTISPRRIGTRPSEHSFTDSENTPSSFSASINSSIADDTHPELKILPQKSSNDACQSLIRSQLDVPINQEPLENVDLENVAEKQYNLLIDGSGMKTIRRAGNRPYMKLGSIGISESRPEVCDKKSEKMREIRCWKLFLLAFLLAILMLILFLPHLPILVPCSNPVYHILKRVNPFYLNRSVPV